MTASFIFEFRSQIEAEPIQAKVAEIWLPPAFQYGSFVDVFSHTKNGTLVCDVQYFFYCFLSDQECISCIGQILNYLFTIALDGRVYYYRFSEAIDYHWSAKPKLSLEDLFTDDYCPNLGGNCLRYELIRPRKSEKAIR